MASARTGKNTGPRSVRSTATSRPSASARTAQRPHPADSRTGGGPQARAGAQLAVVETAPSEARGERLLGDRPTEERLAGPAPAGGAGDRADQEHTRHGGGRGGDQDRAD